MLRGLHDFKNDTNLKIGIEYGLYAKARYNYGIVSDVLMVTGPDLLRHLKTGRQTVACSAKSKIIVVDIDADVHYEQRMKLESYNDPARKIPAWTSFEDVGYDNEKIYEPSEMFSITHNVALKLADIREIKSEIFVDADLMSSVKTAGDALLGALYRQRNTFPIGTPTKGFIFTISLRSGGGLDSNLNWVLKELIPLTGATAYMDRSTNRNLAFDTSILRSSKGFRGMHHRDPGFVISHEPTILHDVTLRQYNDDGGPMLTGLIVYS